VIHDLLRVLCAILAFIFGGGMWAVRRRHRRPTEKDFRRAEAWREASAGRPPGDDHVLIGLDLALTEGCEAQPPPPPRAERLPSDDQKG
jgi:hypothetical protein